MKFFSILFMSIFSQPIPDYEKAYYENGRKNNKYKIIEKFWIKILVKSHLAFSHLLFYFNVVATCLKDLVPDYWVLKLLKFHLIETLELK